MYGGGHTPLLYGGEAGFVSGRLVDGALVGVEQGKGKAGIRSAARFGFPVHAAIGVCSKAKAISNPSGAGSQRTTRPRISQPPCEPCGGKKMAICSPSSGG